MLSVPDAMIAYQRTPGPQADRDVQRMQDAMIDLCENLKDRFAILDAPPTKDVEEVRKWRRRHRTRRTRRSTTRGSRSTRPARC